MRTLGITKKEAAQEEEQSSGLIGRFKDLGEYRHRCLYGPKRRETVVYPTWRKNLETNEMMPSWNTVILPPSTSGFRSLFDSFSAIDKTIQSKKGLDRSSISSPFNRTKRFIYIVLSRDIEVESGIWIGPWEYTTTVSKEIMKIQEEISTKDKTKLRFGPYWTYDIVINKYLDDELYRRTKSKQRSTRYSVSVDPESMNLAGKVPADIIDDPSFAENNPELVQDLYKACFTPDELEIISSYEHSLEDFVRPVTTNEEIMGILEKFPINLDATRETEPIFKFKDELKEEISKFGDRLLAEYETPKQLNESSTEDIIEDSKETAENSNSKEDENDDLSW